MERDFYCEPDICEFLYRRIGIAPTYSHIPQMFGRTCQPGAVYLKPNHMYFSVASSLAEAMQENRATDVIMDSFGSALTVPKNLWSPVDVIRDVDRFLRVGDRDAFKIFNAAKALCDKYIPEDAIPLYECQRANCEDCVISDIGSLPIISSRLPKGTTEVFISSVFSEFTYGIMPYLPQIDCVHIIQKIPRAVKADYFARTLAYFLGVPINCQVICEEV